jgi:hypothetical protein
LADAIAACAIAAMPTSGVGKAAMRGLITLCAVLVFTGAAAVALPLSEFGRVYPYLARQTQFCLLTSIPTQANPITDAELLAEMNQAGRLPGSFACGRCRYDLAGDRVAAYYVKSCR